MIRKLQIKFVAMCMLLVTAVLAVVFLAVYFSAKQNIEVISHQVLQRVIQEEDTQGELPNFGRDSGREDVLLPYFLGGGAQLCVLALVFAVSIFKPFGKKKKELLQ